MKQTLKKHVVSLLLGAALLGIAGLAYAYDHNTTSYVRVSELKAWDHHIDVYFENNQEHRCSGGLKTRFLLEPDDDAKYRLLHSAFLAGKSVQLAYNCKADNFPWIVGVRVR